MLTVSVNAVHCPATTVPSLQTFVTPNSSTVSFHDTCAAAFGQLAQFITSFCQSFQKAAYVSQEAVQAVSGKDDKALQAWAKLSVLYLNHKCITISFEWKDWVLQKRRRISQFFLQTKPSFGFESVRHLLTLLYTERDDSESFSNFEKIFAAQLNCFNSIRLSASIHSGSFSLLLLSKTGVGDTQVCAHMFCCTFQSQPNNDLWLSKWCLLSQESLKYFPIYFANIKVAPDCCSKCNCWEPLKIIMKGRNCS